MPRKTELKVYKDSAETRLRAFVGSSRKYKSVVPLNELVEFLRRLEMEFPLDKDIMGSAFVNLMKSYYICGNANEVAAVGARLFADNVEILTIFAGFLGLTGQGIIDSNLDETRQRKRKRVLMRSNAGTPADSSEDEAHGPVRNTISGTEDFDQGHDRRGEKDDYEDDGDAIDDDEDEKSERERSVLVPALPENQWRLAGDRVGFYFVAGDDIWSLARVDSWVPKLDGLKRYRGRFILGPSMGQLITLSEIEIEKIGGLTDDLFQCLRKIDLPSNWLEILQNSNAAEYTQLTVAHRRLSLEKLITEAGPDWSSLFGAVVWAQSRANEPPWPSIVMDPLTIANDDNKLQDQAVKALKAKRHFVRFLGLPAHSSLGFVNANTLQAYDCADTRDTVFPLDSNPKFKKLKRSFKIAYKAGIDVAESILAESSTANRIQASNLIENAHSSEANDELNDDEHIEEDDSSEASP